MIDYFTFNIKQEHNCISFNESYVLVVKLCIITLMTTYINKTLNE